MGLFRNVTEQMKWKNTKYTEECKKIYENIRFSKVEVRPLHDAVLPTILFVLSAVLLGIAIYFMFAIPDFGESQIAVFAFAGGLLCIALVLTVIKIVQYRKKVPPRYFIKDGCGEFEIHCKKTGGALTVFTIVNATRHKIMYVWDNACSVENDSESAIERNGFHEFLVSPKQVIPKNVYAPPIYKYKKKRTVGNLTYYYFPALNHGLLETRKPRSIKLVNGVVTRICRQIVYPRQDTGYHCLSYSYEYSHVNDENFKLHIPAYVREQAETLKFTIPQESANIVYDKAQVTF